MANRFCNLDGNAKIKDEYGKINIGFDKVENEIDDLGNEIIDVNDRVNEIITTPVDGVSAQEIIDARHGEPTLGAKIADIADELDAHKADNTSAHGINTLAKKTMGETYNATLQNGWSSGSGLRYSKNDLNQLHIRGNMVAGTITPGTVIATLPEGYRPYNTVSIATYNMSGAKITSGIAISPNGNLAICAPGATENASGNVLHINAIIQL